MPKTILTGLQATGKMHLGNYLGAILPTLKKQQELEPEDKLFLFIPDLHSLTTPVDHKSFYNRVIDNMRIYLAAGFDPQKNNVYMYRQSRVSAHSELTWILSCFGYFGELNKMTQFKDKSRNKGENVSVGLFTYPILMVADILLYNAEYIPLGDDQKQHLELARDLAIRINNKFEKPIFAIPKPWKEQLEFMNLKVGVRIRSLQNPDKKMSKSVIDPKGTILLEDDPKEAAKKIMSAATDSVGEINWDWKNQAGITNLLQILACLSDSSVEQVKKDWTGNTKYGELKRFVAFKVEDFLIDFRNKFETVDYEKAENILQQDEEKVEFIARQTLNKIQQAVGLKK
jgi:tryptophanyl-tRNA synthetase